MPSTDSKDFPSAGEKRYREFFENSSDAVFLMDVTPEGRFRFAEINPADEALIGLTNAQVRGKYVEDVAPDKKVADATIANFRRCIAAGCALNFEETLDFSQGPRQLNTTLIPLRDDAGNIHRIAGIVRDVTAQKQAGEQFALLDFALNHVREAAFLIDEKARFHYINDESCRTLGYGREELLHLGVGDVDPDFPEERWPAHWKALKEAGTLIIEGRHKAKDGRIFPVEISANYFEYGGRGYNLALVRDITERKRTEEALESERKLFIGGPNVAFKWRAAEGWPVEYVSPNIAEQFGYAPEDLVGGKVFYAGIVHPDDLVRVADEVATFSKDGAPCFEQEYRILRADGEYRWIYDFTVVERNAAGTITHYHGYISDITERKRSEQRLHLLDFAMNRVREPLYLIDRSDMRFLYVNDEACRALGYSRDEMMGMTVFDIDPDYTPEMAIKVRHQAELAGSVTMERNHRAKDGHVFPVEIFTSIFEYEGKRLSVVLSRDISERKRAQAELQRLNETLEQRVQEALARNREKDHLLIQQSRLAAMGEMVHNIAHQWRQPINVLSILLSNLQDSYDYGELTKEELHEKVSKGKQVVQSMSSTIDDFRDFFRPGKEKGPFSVDHCLREVEGILGASLSNRNIELTDGIDETICANGYRSEFSQVLLNVITNAKEAIVATRKEGGRIRVHAAERDGMVEVRVADNGGGIPEDVLPKIFDPYFTTKEKGSGIGLYMSKMIIEGNMGGEISARNIEGGAEILIRMPAVKP